MRNTFAVAIAVLALTGCSGGGDGDSASGSETSAVCTTAIGGGSASAESSGSSECVGCSVSDEDNAIDGVSSTRATLNYPIGSSGSLMITATAQPGIVFPAGSNATVFVSFQNGHSGVISVRTLMAGVLQDQTQENNIIAFEGNTATASFSVSAETPFDAVQLEIADAQAQESREMRVLEMCADS